MDQANKSLRKDLKELLERQAGLQDENRPEAVAKRHKKGQRTARENVMDLCDEDSFLEYGSLIVAAQRGRRSMEELIRQTPADGLIAGTASVNAALFDDAEACQCVIMSYDYTVLAGTQGAFNHKKTDRLLGIASKQQRPVIFFLEGGGGRPGDVDFYPVTVGGLDLMTFVEFARLSGLVPRIAIVSGYCFAGNAVLAGCADVIIATENTSIGMGGPAMIEGGGLGKVHPKEVGPAKMQATNGVIDVLVQDEAEAVATAKQYLSYFQGVKKDWSCAEQEQLRHILPEDRRFAYDVRKLIHLLCDQDSVLELRSTFGKSLLTALVRIEGRPIGLIANNVRHLGGAIDSDASDKAARFLQMCNAFGLPILSLCDVPGFMVGVEAERTAMVRHTARLFVQAASLQVPYLTIVLRKAYGLGAMAMACGSFRQADFTISWPSGEFGAMGLEGAVQLGFRKELEAVEGEARQALYDRLLQEAYDAGKAINAAAVLEIDEVIDPKDSRRWIVQALMGNAQRRGENNHPTIDTW